MGRTSIRLFVSYSLTRRANMTSKRPDEPGLVDDGGHLTQCLDYFAASECEVILIFNFGKPRLEWKRLFPPKHILEHRRKRGASNSPG
jgi:hypothetical protein